jgi:hypothetical protein
VVQNSSERGRADQLSERKKGHPTEVALKYLEETVGAPGEAGVVLPVKVVISRASPMHRASYPECNNENKEQLCPPIADSGLVWL